MEPEAVKRDPMTAQEYLRRLGSQKVTPKTELTAAIDAARLSARPVKARGLTVVLQTNFTVVNTTVEIAVADPRRRLLVVSNPDATIRVWPGAGISSGVGGILLTATDSVFVATEDDWGAIMQLPWFLQTTAAPANVSILQELYSQ